MKKTIVADDYENGTKSEIKYEPAKECPMCHTSFNSETLCGYLVPFSYDNYGQIEEAKLLYVIHYCSFCEKCFFSIYCPHDEFAEYYEHLDSYPKKYKPSKFPKCIEKVSPKFVSTYNEAMSAEKYGLHDICGFGYRRALEFLIKDFCITTYPDDKGKIIAMPLAACINQYIEYSNLKSVAKRATWLGNDHAHYVSLHTDKDLSDLKTLVDLSMHWVTIELETAEAQSIAPK